MKAYLVRDKKCYEDYCTVVFAESAGKAKQEALFTDACSDAVFIDIEARRVPELDKYYRGYSEMNWRNPKDRIGMVRYADMQCSSEISYYDLRCEDCEAKEYCDRYEAIKEFEKGE